MPDDQGQAVVRRFTQTLDDDDNLQQVTKNAQRTQDEQDRLAEQFRLQQLFDRPIGQTSASQSSFDAAEIARKELEKVCNDLDDKHKSSQKSKFWTKKESSKVRANKALRDTASYDLEDVKIIVESAQKQWQDKQGVIHKNFIKICTTLSAHKEMFSLFPQENMYTEVLASSLALFVQTAANHADIAETLSSCLSDITSKVTTCQKYVQVVLTDEMRRRLANVYKGLFEFYREAMQYFLSSSTSKFFKAFNSDIPKRYQSATDAIEGQIRDMDREAQIAGQAMQRYTISYLQDKDRRLSLKLEEIRQIQQQTLMHQKLLEARQTNAARSKEIAGQAALKFLMAGFQADRQRRRLQPESLTASPANGSLSSLQNHPVGIKKSRKEAQKYFDGAQELMIGDDGTALLSEGQLDWLADDDILMDLEKWMGGSESSTLWIETPASLHQDNGAKAAAMGVIQSAWNAQVNFVSHLCERPRKSPLKELTNTEAGVLGLIYSLIYQLLQFGVEDIDLDLSEERFQRLLQGEQVWSESLEMLRDLLLHTPDLPFCVIHGINELEMSEGYEWCHSLLDVLFDCQKEREGIFNILLTTCGRSRVLAQRQEIEDHCLSRESSRQMRHQGKRINLEREASDLS